MDENISKQEFLFQLATELAYQKFWEENHVPKLSPSSSNLYVRKTCQIKYCKGYKIYGNLFEMRKICVRKIYI